MNELLLNAILNLFALQASLLDPEHRSAAATVVSRYLFNHLQINNPEVYSGLFEAAMDLHCTDDVQLTHKEQVCQLAQRLKSLLTRFEQHIVVIYSLELCRNDHGSFNSVRLLASELDIPEDVFFELEALAGRPTGVSRLSPSFLLVNPHVQGVGEYRILNRPEFHSSLVIYHLQELDSYFLMLAEGQCLSADSISIPSLVPYLLQPGFILRDTNGMRIYHAEVAAAFQDESASAVIFQADGLEFRYPKSDSGLHNFSVLETGGKLVGIMGASGAGKSTLLGILNGQAPPDSGRLTINGIDLYRDAGRLEGVIGYVPQDDLLFADLTVFDNLFFNASLCLADLGEQERTDRVEHLLDELHQLPTRDLMVGSPLDKSISGGERKRLNIALELIREPAVLFVDEPTSGLSSADSENVMALLKAQAAKGKLVIVVIHQPSSRIFKMFDSLWLLDKGGRPIYTGNPLDAIVYFRTEIHQAGMDEYACPRCGSVNPEQILEIVEACRVDGNGRYTRERRISPDDWHQRYLLHRSRADRSQQNEMEMTGEVEHRLRRPDIWGQFRIFFQRTLKGRLHNRQYLLINLLEPPFIALVAALVCHGAWGTKYVFMDNGNLGNYFFISVIVALFLGMSVSAEEINRDQNILNRESFLHLSWLSYISSKAVYLALVVAIQMALFTLVGNTVLRIPDMYLSTWVVLFSCGVLSCLLGLNISASLRSAVNIYILIPLLLVPQIMLGGATVPYDEIMHRDAGSRNVPWAANIMPSRWGYEALLVQQYTSNKYMRLFFDDDCSATQTDYMIQLHIPEIRALADYPLLKTDNKNHRAESVRRLLALENELLIQERSTGIRSGLTHDLFQPDAYNAGTRDNVKDYLLLINEQYRKKHQDAVTRKERTEKRLHDSMGIDGTQAFKKINYNKDVASLALNTRSMETVRLSGKRLVQVVAPICQLPESASGQAHFMSAVKRLGAWRVNTPLFNLAVLWGVTAFLFAALQTRLLPRLLRKFR